MTLAMSQMKSAERYNAHSRGRAEGNTLWLFHILQNWVYCMCVSDSLVLHSNCATAMFINSQESPNYGSTFNHCRVQMNVSLHLFNHILLPTSYHGEKRINQSWSYIFSVWAQGYRGGRRWRSGGFTARGGKWDVNLTTSTTVRHPPRMNECIIFISLMKQIMNSLLCHRHTGLKMSHGILFPFSLSVWIKTVTMWCSD